jgi:hypothetical protein
MFSAFCPPNKKGKNNRELEKILLRRVHQSLPATRSPPAPKRKKLLESGFENEAGNEKERREMGMD